MKKYIANIITGSRIIFSLPHTLTFAPTTYSVAIICVLATIAAMQEVYFIAKGQEVL